MGRRFRPLTAGDLAALPEGSPLALAGDRASTQAWAEAVTRRWGWCGVLASHEDEPIGLLTLSPTSELDRLPGYPGAGLSPDAAVLVGAGVSEAHRGHGVGRHLVQAAAGQLLRREVCALEAVGSPLDAASGLPPLGWLEAVGFVVVRPHPVTPRLRMDLQTTQRWLPDLGAAWSRLTGLVAQPTAPEPATYARREGVEPVPVTAAPGWG